MYRITNIYSLALILIAASISNVHGQELLKSIQNKFNAAKDISANFQQYTNGVKQLSGKFQYKHNNKMRLEMNDLIIISDGKSNWNYNKRENKVIISEVYEDDQSYISLNKLINEYPSLCIVEEKTDGDVNSILLKPKSAGLNFNSAALFVNKENLISKVLIDEPVSGVIEIEFSNYKLNQNLPGSQFTFNPPEGSAVIDLR